jgi:hypothetical protein
LILIKKMGWAIFWAIFSQTHLVTLLADEVSQLHSLPALIVGQGDQIGRVF